MDDDLIKSMFLRARDQYESSVRWAFLTLLFLLLVHLITFSQFVRLKVTLSAAEAAVRQTSDADTAVEELSTELTVLHRSYLGRLDSRLDEMQTDMIADFQSLQQVLARLDSPTSAEFADVRAEDLLLDQDSPLQSPIQQPPSRPGSGPESRFQLDEEVKAQLKQARNNEETLEILQPVIEAQIIEYRFTQLNDFWRNRLEPDIIQQTNLILEDLEEQRLLFPDGADYWTEIEANLKQTAQVAATLQFQPFTDDPYWWSTIAGKEKTLSVVEEAAINQLNVEESAQAVDQLQRQVTAALDQHLQLQKAVQQELENVENTFTEQQGKLAALGQPYEFLALDLDFLVAKFPLILGIFLAAITVWPVYRMQELAWAVALMAERSQTQSSWEWFYARSGLPLAAAASSEQTPDRQFWWQGWSRRMDVLGRGLLFCCWIGVAAWQLADLQETDSTWLAVAGCAVILTALGYRWYGMSKVARLALREHPRRKLRSE